MASSASVFRSASAQLKSVESGLPDIYKEQGAIYEVRGDTRAAVQAYNKYLALSPNAPDRKQIEALILSIGSGK